MDLIPPLEIASKIMTLIQESEKELIIVTPYVSINGWDKMKKCLTKAVERGVRIVFVARKNAKQDLSSLLEIGITPILVEDLHAKIYINDKYAIVTSLNMILYSDMNSIDIGYITQTKQERVELLEFVQKHIVDIKPKLTPVVAPTVFKSSKVKSELDTRQVEKLFNEFSYSFQDCKFVQTSTYIFCGHLIPFADVMISEEYTIKIKKSEWGAERVINTIQKTEL